MQILLEISNLRALLLQQGRRGLSYAVRVSACLQNIRNISKTHLYKFLFVGYKFWISF